MNRWRAGVAFCVLGLAGLPIFGQNDGSVRIMPLGDSITQAAKGRASYRYWLWQSLEKAGYAVDFVGSMEDNYGGEPKFADFDRDHEGHWGWRVDQVLPKLAAWLGDARPQIVLCHLGSNDIREAIPQIVGELGRLIDVVRAYDETCTILLAQLIPIGKYPKIARLNEAIAELAAARRKAGQRVVLVDHYTGYDGEAHNYDKVHPNEQGEKLMAERWFAALKPVLEQ